MNSADRVIRVFDIEEVLKQRDDEVEALQRLQDLVNRCVEGGRVCEWVGGVKSLMRVELDYHSYCER